MNSIEFIDEEIEKCKKLIEQQKEILKRGFVPEMDTILLEIYKNKLVNLEKVKLELYCYKDLQERLSKDGKNMTMECAFENILYYNGHKDYLLEIVEDLKNINENEIYIYESQKHGKWDTEEHMIWMFLVGMFGEWGTSIRCGWIEKIKECINYIEKLVERVWKDE